MSRGIGGSPQLLPATRVLVVFAVPAAPPEIEPDMDAMSGASKADICPLMVPASSCMGGSSATRRLRVACGLLCGYGRKDRARYFLCVLNSHCDSRMIDNVAARESFPEGHPQIRPRRQNLNTVYIRSREHHCSDI